MSSRIDDLEPVTQQMCRAFLLESMAAGLALRVTHTLRTMDEQAHLYAKGRTLPGPVVTNAPPGASPHNFGAAFDVCFSGSEPYAESHPWAQVGVIGERCGLRWGGHFTHLADRPHLERRDWAILRGVA